MFDHEKTLIKGLKSEYSFDNFIELLEDRKNSVIIYKNLYKSTIQLYNEGNEIYEEISSDKYSFDIERHENLLTISNKIELWLRNFKKLKNYIENNKEENKKFSCLKEYAKLIDFNALFEKIVNDKNDFLKAVKFSNDFLMKPYNEDEIDYFYNFVKKFDSLSENIKKYFPDKVCSEIEEIRKSYDDIQTIQKIYNKMDKYIEKYYFYVENYKSFIYDIEKCGSKPKSCIISCKVSEEGVSLINEFQTEKSRMNIKILSNYDSKYKEKLNKIIESVDLLKEFWEKYQAKKFKRDNIKEFFSKIFHVVFLLAIFSIIGVTIVKTCISFCQNQTLGSFWGIVLGIIAGALFGILRIFILFGFGSVWWPESLSTLIYKVSSAEINNSIIIINIIFILLAFVYIILHHRDKFIFDLDASEFICILYMGSAICLVLSVVYRTITTMLLSLDFWAPLSVIIGIISGLFRTIMLIFGAGFWWQSLYSNGAVTGTVINSFFYGLIAIVLIFIVISSKEGVNRK